MTFSASAHAGPSIEACSNAYTRGQEERLAGRLFSARSEFSLCADPSCPQAIAGDCKRWATEVEADLPTVRLEVRNTQGKAIDNLSVSSDGVSIPPRQLSRAVVLDAGPHLLRFEAPGYQPLELEKALRPSDRELEVAVVLHLLGETPNVAPAVLSSVPEQTQQKGVPPLAVGFAGAGVLALGVAVYFDLSSHNQYRDLKASCAPVCSHAQADSVQSKAVAGDVALLVSAAAFGAAAWFYFSAPTPGSRAAFHVEPRADGARLSLRLPF